MSRWDSTSTIAEQDGVIAALVVDLATAVERITDGLTLHPACHGDDPAQCALMPGAVHLGSERYCLCCSHVTGHARDAFVPHPCPTARALGAGQLKEPS